MGFLESTCYSWKNKRMSELSGYLGVECNTYMEIVVNTYHTANAA